MLEPFVYGITKSPAIVDEMIQETFLRIWMSRDKLTEIDNPKSWIYRITSNVCVSWLRRNIVEKKIVHNISDSTPSEAETTTEAVDEGQLKTLIQEAIQKLPDQRRRVYRLSRDEGLNIPEIAGLLGLSVSTVKNTLVSSLKFIREYLARHGYQVSLLWILSRLFFKNIFFD